MSDTAALLAGRRILLVEDEYFIADAMAGWMRDAGAEVVGPVPSVEGALGLIEAAAGLDGAVLDVNLGGGETVYPVAGRLNERRVPYLFATGDVRIIDDPVHQGRPRLEKPITRVQLLRALEGLLSVQSPPHRR